MRRVVVHIDCLTLTGFRPEDGHAIAAGLEAELVKLFSVPATATRVTALRDEARLRAGDVQIAHGATPERVGRVIARGIAGQKQR